MKVYNVYDVALYQCVDLIIKPSDTKAMETRLAQCEEECQKLSESSVCVALLCWL